MIIGLLSNDPVAWLPNSPENQSIRYGNVVTLLRSRTVAHMDEEDVRTLASLIWNENKSASTRALRDTLNRLALVRSGSEAVPNLVVGGTRSEPDTETISSIYDLPNTNACGRCLNPLPGAEPRQTREKVYRANLREMATRTSHVDIYDQYCGEDVRQHGVNSGTLWVIRRMFEDGVPSIRLITAADREETAQKVRAFLTGAVGESDLDVVIGSLAAGWHDRHVRFQFGLNRTSLAIGLAAGVGKFFGKEKTTEILDMYFVTAARAREREVDLAKAAERWVN